MGDGLLLLGFWNGNPWGNDGDNGNDSQGTGPSEINIHFVNHFPNLGSFGTASSSSSNYGGGSTSVAVVANNIESWPAVASQLIMANLLTEKLGLASSERHLLLNPSNTNATISIYNYCLDNFNNTNAANQFANEVIDQMMQNPGLNINIQASTNSPAFIDTSSVMGNTPEEIKFREIYNILQQSSNFKNLFTNLFGVTNFINIKFKIENINQPGVAGNCQLFSYAFGGLTNVITINRENLLTNSNVNIATAIIHECIHAFLNIKLRHPNIGMSINNINNLNLQDCINTYYNGFSGDQSQHDFYVDFLIPTISSILNEIKDELFTSQQISIAENPLYSNQYIFGVNATIPATYNEQVLPWSWEDFFYYQSQVGLQNCTAFNVINPLNSSDYLNFIQYVQTGTLIFAP